METLRGRKTSEGERGPGIQKNKYYLFKEKKEKKRVRPCLEEPLAVRSPKQRAFLPGPYKEIENPGFPSSRFFQERSFFKR